MKKKRKMNCTFPVSNIEGCGERVFTYIQHVSKDYQSLLPQEFLESLYRVKARQNLNTPLLSINHLLQTCYAESHCLPVTNYYFYTSDLAFSWPETYRLVYEKKRALKVAPKTTPPKLKRRCSGTNTNTPKKKKK